MNNLRFADDIVIIVESLDDIETELILETEGYELKKDAKQIRLRMTSVN